MNYRRIMNYQFGTKGSLYVSVFLRISSIHFTFKVYHFNLFEILIIIFAAVVNKNGRV